EIPTCPGPAAVVGCVQPAGTTTVMVVDPRLAPAMKANEKLVPVDPVKTSEGVGTKVLPCMVPMMYGPTSGPPPGAPGGGPLVGPYIIGTIQGSTFVPTPSEVLTGSTGTNFSFAFMAGANLGSTTMTVVVPAGWTQPTTAAGPGHVGIS